MKVTAIIQARMGSQRLAGKSLVDIGGQPLLGHVIDRVRASTTIDSIVVATTTDSTDDVLADYVRRKGTEVYRGSPDDVLDRFYRAATEASADLVVRITADDPFKDPDVIDLIVGRMLADPSLDYASNTLEPSFPEGLDVEAFTFMALQRVWHEATLPSEREHVTPGIWKHQDRFRIASVIDSEDRSALRWTLDYEDDLRFARAIYGRLYRGQVFKTREILDLLREDPRLQQINTGFKRNEGYIKSLAAESKEPKPEK